MTGLSGSLALIRRATMVVVTCCLLVTLALPARAAEIPTIASQALIDLVASHKGKVVVLNFFASWCPPCREEIPGLLRLNREYGPDKVVFIGLSVDEDLKALERFAATTAFSYPIYRAESDVAYLYGVSAIPHNAVYDRAGKLVANQGGYVEERALKEFLEPLLKSKP